MSICKLFIQITRTVKHPAMFNMASCQAECMSRPVVDDYRTIENNFPVRSNLGQATINNARLLIALTKSIIIALSKGLL